MTRTTTTTTANREQWRTMRAENLAAAEQLDNIGADYACDTFKAFGPVNGDLHTIRQGRLMIKALAKNAERLADKFRKAAARLPSRHALATGSRSYPRFTPGESTADYLARYATLNGKALGFNMLNYDFDAYQQPCTLYEGGALDFEPIEQPIDAPELTTEDLQPVAIVSGLTGATITTVPAYVARQVSELIASATTAATIEQTSEAAQADHQEEPEAGRELATVDACEAGSMATRCEAGSASNMPSAPTHGHASSAARPAPYKPTHDGDGQRIGQHVAGKSGNWCAVMFTDATGRPSLEFEGLDGAREVFTFATGRDRMAALQTMAQRADQDAIKTARERRLNAFDAMTATAADVHAMGAEYLAELLEDLTDCNLHTEALILQALAIGREDLAERARDNLRDHLRLGYLSPELSEARRQISTELHQSDKPDPTSPAADTPSATQDAPQGYAPPAPDAHQQTAAVPNVADNTPQDLKRRQYKGVFVLVSNTAARKLWNAGQPIAMLDRREKQFTSNTENAEYRVYSSFEEKRAEGESCLRYGRRIYFYAPADTQNQCSMPAPGAAVVSGLQPSPDHTPAPDTPSATQDAPQGYAPPAPHDHQQTAPVPNDADNMPRAVADESAPEFTRTQPQPFDLLALIAAGAKPESLIGLGIVYNGDMANSPGRGAITDIQPCNWYKYKITVIMEDGRISLLNPLDFMGTCGNRYQTDFKHHGAPYLAELTAARLAIEAADKAAKQAAADDKARQRRELPQQWPQLKAYTEGGKLYGCTLAAANIRVLLKENFPKVKFSVKTDKFSGGDSISVRWTDGPTAKAVEAITDQFCAGHFNGSEDIYEYSRSVFRDLFGDAKYIHTTRENSDEAIAQAIAAEYPSAEGRPTVEDYRKGRGAFCYSLGNEWAQRRIRERLNEL